MASIAGCGSKSSDCPPGDRGCPCTALATCNGELVCDSNQCLEPHQHALQTNRSGLRACELVVVDGTERVAGVAFGEGTRGSHARRGNRTAITVVSRSDAELPASQVRVQTLASGDSTAGALVVERSACFDRTGTSVTGAAVTLGR